MPTAENFDEVREIVGIAPETSEKGDDIPFRNGKVLDEPIIEFYQPR